MKKLILPLILILASAISGMSQCNEPVVSFLQDFSDPVFKQTVDPPACWTETEPSQTAYNTDAMRIFGAHNGDPQGMVITQELLNVRGILTFKAKKGESFFNLPGDGISVGVIPAEGGFANLFPFTYEATEATYTFDFSSYTGSGNRIAFVRTGANKKVISITDISYTSACDPGVTALAQDITVSLDETGNATITPNQIDDGSMDFCGSAASLSLDIDTFTCDDLGSNMVTLTAEDTFGNTQNATANVTVLPYIGVVVKSDPIVIELDAAGSATIDASDMIVESGTTCGTISLSLNQSSFTCSDVGDFTVMITATHSTGPDAVFEKMISFTDNISPIVSVNSNINLPLDGTTFSAELTNEMVDNGSADNCSISTSTLSKTAFSCNDVGENIITYTVTDAQGNESETSVTVNVVSSIVDETVTTSGSNMYCPSGSNPGATISTGSSVIGIDYYLRDSKDNAIVDGPKVGTGSALNFTTGTVDGSKTFNVYAEKTDNGGALDFDGTDDVVNLGTDHRGIHKEITVATWIKTNFSGASNFISGKYDGINGYLLYIDANGKAGFDGRDGAGYKQSGFSTTSVNDGQWHLLTGTINLNTGEWKIFVDGVEESSNTFAPGASLAANSAPMTFGAHTTLYFTGQIDQFSVYNTALDASSITNLVSTCSTGEELGLVGLYTLDEGTGISVADGSPSGIPGTLTNMDENSDWISGNLACEVLCDLQMSTEITFGDGESPQISALDATVQLDASGEGTLTPVHVENGSQDNCTTSENLISSLSQTSFGCGDVGEQTVTYSVTDEAGNVSTTEITVTVVSPIGDEVPAVESSGFCSGESTTISIPASASGVDYFLRKSEDNTIVDGPISGTGSAIDFSTGALTETTQFNVLAQFGGGDGNSLDFDGSNDHIDTDVDIPVTSALTIEAWIYPEGGLTKTILTNSIHAGTGSTNLEPGEFWFNTASNTGGNGLTFTYIATNGIAATHSRTNILTFNEWNHVAVAFDGATGIANMWVNGVALTTTNTTGTSSQMGRTGSTLSIGKRHGGSGSAFFDGKIDEVRVWNSVRTTQDILSNKDVCLEGNESELIAYFDFEEGTDAIISDQVASGSGTLVNFDSNVAWVDGVVGCVDLCELQLSTEVTVDVIDTDPIALANDITIQLEASGSISISSQDVDGGSSDDCTSAEDLIFTLDKSTFDCTDVGTNPVDLTVTDLAGNSATTTVNVTILHAITDQDVTTETATVCPGSATNVSISASQSGFNYYLRNAAEQVIEGPIEGTGQAISFNTGAITNETTFNVFAELPPSGDEALVLAGNSGFVQIPNSNSLQLAENWTIEAWVKPIGSVLNVVETYNANGGFILRTNGSKWQAYAMQSSSVFSIVTSVTSVQVDQWTHVAATFNETTNELKIYVNGVLDATNGNATVDQRGTGTTIKLGARGDDSQINTEHVQDEVRIWNVERTAQEIADNKSGTLVGNEMGLVAYYDFNNLPFQASEMTIIDRSGNGNDGTMIGSYSESNFMEGPVVSSDVSCGLQMTSTQTITPEDNENPEVITQDLTLILDSNGNASISVSDIENGSSDNCTSLENLTFNLDITDFDISHLGENTVTLSVTDLSGNIGTGTATVTISDKESQTATFTGVADKTFGDADFDISVTADSGLPVSLTVVSGGLSIVDNTQGRSASSSPTTFTITGAGTAVIRASNDGDATYSPLQEDITINVAKADQTITITPIADKVQAAAPFDVSASINTGLELSYAVSGPATISGTTVTLDGTLGTVTVTVSQQGTDNYNAASNSTSFEVIEKTAQTITFADLDDQTYGSPAQTLSATASSNLAVSYAVISGPVSINGNVMTITGVGEVTIEANQEGDDDFAAAPAVQKVFTIAKAPLQVTADSFTITYGEDLPTLTFTYSGFVNNETSANLDAEPTISANTGVIKGDLDAGTYDIILSGGSAPNYAFTLVNGTLTIVKTDQTVSIDAIDDKLTTDGPFDVAASATSGWELSYEVTGPASMTGTTVTLDGTPGTVTITATQAGSDNHNAASASVSFAVNAPLANERVEASVQVYPNPASSYL
ncbi:MAG: LamG-like jellyroll fold domain-containing protein, partial [Cyclobacteriaceae bacterium]